MKEESRIFLNKQRIEHCSRATHRQTSGLLDSSKVEGPSLLYLSMETMNLETDKCGSFRGLVLFLVREIFMSPHPNADSDLGHT
jgi:hypothetical protein